jgi:hypothetical protein
MSRAMRNLDRKSELLSKSRSYPRMTQRTACLASIGNIALDPLNTNTPPPPPPHVIATARCNHAAPPPSPAPRRPRRPVAHAHRFADRAAAARLLRVRGRADRLHCAGRREGGQSGLAAGLGDTTGGYDGGVDAGVSVDVGWDDKVRQDAFPL